MRHEIFSFSFLFFFFSFLKGGGGWGGVVFCRNTSSDEVYVCLDAVLVRQEASNECFHFISLNNNII